ncbi:FTR1 family iron permease [Nodosilinea sp. LEGE 06152]|uniref:FTR1 family iron permease n=1 Tax=Nodosilinea sp. LEGE 06152 TaxID=2777966 RepID=UPI00187F9E5E|nr:FTR1 family protein [Nodosilinea sp. LEGE 06152]MBE9158995.1 FTR1 family iron permease [Nodosilinea sp. LEGE 06152]
MDFTAALPTFLITLREGVEAALVVGIVLACLAKANRQVLNPWAYAGVGAGLAGSIMLGIALGMGLQQLQQGLPGLQMVIKPLLNVLFGAIAVILLSWMLLWMTRQSRSLKGELEGTVQSALDDTQTAGWSIFSLVCIAVLREGFETVLFVFTNVETSVAAGVGAIAGLLGAVLIGLALFGWGLRINLKRFFQIMGVLLLLIVGGLVISVCKNLDAALAAISQINPTADLCFAQDSCVLGPLLWDGSRVLSDRQFPGILLKTLLGYRDHLYLVQILAYLGFLVLVGTSYFRSLNLPASTTQKAAPSQS